MAESPTAPGGRRVIALLRQGGPERRSLPDDPADGLQYVPVASPYEAAAELLAAPAVALVMDLGLLGPRHARLLEIARQLNVRLLGLGSAGPGLKAEDLRSVRVVLPAELPAALAEAARSVGHAASEAPGEPAAETPSAPGRYVSDLPPPEAEEAARAAAPAEGASPAPARVPEGPAAPGSEEARAAAPTAVPASASDPSALLSPEELAALMGSHS